MVGIKRWTLALIALLLPICAWCEERPPEVFPRLFSATPGRLVKSGMITAAFGGAFASQGGQEYLGLFSIGLGGVAELEFSTTHILTNIVNLSEHIGTTALKFSLFGSKVRDSGTSAVMSLRSNRWAEVSRSGGFEGPAAPESGYEIYRVEYDAHVTSLTAALTHHFNDEWQAHFGMNLTDLRTRNTVFYGNPTIYPKNLKKNLVGVFGALQRRTNENTYSIAEFGTLPQIVFNDRLRGVKAENVMYYVIGVRYHLSPMAAVDAGLRYRSDFSGLADTEIRAGLNVAIDLAKKFQMSH